MACHIYAVGKGPPAKRVPIGTLPFPLGDIRNGIWMCYRHGKVIDNDERTFTPELLVYWRILAERRAGVLQDGSFDHESAEDATFQLLDCAVQSGDPKLRTIIDEAIFLSCVADTWGHELAATIRDLAIELALNGFSHGKASFFRIKIFPRSIVMIDNGLPFSLDQLSSPGSAKGGGWESLFATRKNAAEVLLSYRRDDLNNEVTSVKLFSADDVIKSVPCSVNLGYGPESTEKALLFIRDHPECSTVFLVPNGGIFSYSDLSLLSYMLVDLSLLGRDLAIVGYPHSQGIKDFIALRLPTVRLVELPR